MSFLNQPLDVSIDAAAQQLLAGGLVAFPTETVWGLGADAENPQAIDKIYQAKKRPANHPVIVHLAPEADIAYWAQSIPSDAYRLIKAFWPGPLTLILTRANHIPDRVSGGQASIGLRCPSNPVAQQLLRRFAQLKKQPSAGVAAPSANRFGRLSPTRAAHVQAEFADSSEAIYILAEESSTVGIESTIIDFSRYDDGVGPVLLRPGHITPTQIEAVLGKPLVSADGSAPRASGTLKAHYAPNTPLQILDRQTLIDALKQFEQDAQTLTHPDTLGVLGFGVRPHNLSLKVKWQEMPSLADDYAEQLYANLRKLDKGGHKQILVEAPPAGPEWLAVNDRLSRAAAAFT